MAEEIPATATAGQYAKVIGVTERVIAGRKGDGRLPVTEAGRIDLHAVIRAGHLALARKPSAGAAADNESVAERFDSGVRMAVMVTAHLTLMSAARQGSNADLGIATAEAAREALLMCGIDHAVPDRLQAPESV